MVNGQCSMVKRKKHALTLVLKHLKQTTTANGKRSLFEVLHIFRAIQVVCEWWV
jgi:hypothetical protein